MQILMPYSAPRPRPANCACFAAHGRCLALRVLDAIRARKEKFTFEDVEISLRLSIMASITMNPGCVAVLFDGHGHRMRRPPCCHGDRVFPQPFSHGRQHARRIEACHETARARH